MKQLLLLTILITTITASAQTLVKDINPGSASGYPVNFVTMGNYTYFVASDGEHGFELWKTDATADGTTMVKDINEDGDGLAEDEDGLQYANLTVLNNELYFFATDGGITGYELWKSDGTENGTVQVRDIYPGVNKSADVQNPICVFNGNLYFAADSNSNMVELWKSDGTANGTQKLTELNGGTPRKFFVSGNTLYFVADSGFAGESLFVTDGTPNGTRFVKDVNTNAANAFIGNFAAFNNKVYFSAVDSGNILALWVTDGSTSGTKVVVDSTSTGRLSSVPEQITVLGDKMIFAAGDFTTGTELWISDGTRQGTSLLKDINTATHQSSYPYYLTLLGNKIFFEATDNTNDEELWSTDGTAEGTVRFMNINPGTSSNPDHFKVANGKLFFTADDGTHGREGWQTDGTVIGTRQFIDLCPGEDCGGDPYGFTGNGNMVLFDANSNATGHELYRLGEPTGIENVTMEINFRVQPNPAKEYVTVVTNESIIGSTLQLFDITGNTISSGILSSSTYQLNTSALPTGMYFIKLAGLHGETGVKKVVIE